MPYTQIVDACFEDKIGARGLQSDQYREMLARCAPAVDGIRSAYDDRSAPLYRLPEKTEDLAAAKEICETFRDGASDICFLGIGGSSLGAQAIAQLRGFGAPGFAWRKDEPRFHFFENLDAHSFDSALERFDLRTTRFVISSKSGGTAEPIIQMLAAIQAIEAAGGGKYLKHHFVVITERQDNPLYRLAQRRELPVLEHEADVGGRYSVLTLVGLFPALLMGLDAAAVRVGAQSVLKPLLDGASNDSLAPAVGAAISLALAEHRSVSSNVLMPYSDRLDRFSMWYRQIWAESLGKGGKGTTPEKALGPVDQHSQLQLYLDGPADKFVTLMLTKQAGKGPRVGKSVIEGDPDLAYLADRTIGDLVDAEQRATAETLVAAGCPVRTFDLSAIDEFTMGALFMHFMLETIISAHVMGVNAFDQPAVEDGKVMARKFLRELR
jgi:glucose-6-phosphate isomerase